MTEQAALKCLYLAIMSLDPTGRAAERWINRWKAVLSAFHITFDGRLSAGGSRTDKASSHRRLDRPVPIRKGYRACGEYGGIWMSVS